MLIYYTWVKSRTLTHGFASYYTSARLLSEGGDMTRAYDTAYYFTKMHEYGFGNVKDLSNLPTGSFIMLPLCRFEPVTAKAIWSYLSVIFLFLAVLILFRTFGIQIDSVIGLILILLSLLFYPFYYNIAYGQAYAFLLLLASIGIFGFRKQSALLVSIPLALLIILKGYGFYPLAVLLFFKEFKPFFLTAAIIAVIFFITLPVFGFSAWQMYYHKSYSVVSFGNYASSNAYQTFNSLLGHLFSYNPVSNQHALADIPQKYIYYFLQAAGFTSLFILSLKFTESKNNILFVLSVSINVMFAPAAEDYHSVLYLPLLFITGRFLYDNYKIYEFPFLLYIISVLMIALPLGFRLTETTEFPFYLFGYPRLYGAALLVIITVFISKNKLLKI